MKSRPRPIRCLLTAVLTIFASHDPLAAQSIGVITKAGVLNTSEYLINADAANPGPGYDRDAISVNVQATVTRTGSSQSSQNFELIVRLRDASGNALALSGGTGAGNTEVSLGTKTAVFPNPLGGSQGLAWSGRVQPSLPLLPSGRYQMQYVLGRVTPGAAILQNFTETNSRPWLHFTNTVSGDPALNAKGLATVSLERPVIITAEPGQETFRANYSLDVARYDDFATAPSTANIPFNLTIQLQDTSAGNAVIPITNATAVQNVSIASHDGGNPSAPARVTGSGVIAFMPVNLTAFDPTHLYRLVLTVSHEETAGIPVGDAGGQTTAVHMLRLSGGLVAGAVNAAFHAVGNDPGAAGTVLGAVMNAPLVIPAGQGYFSGLPGYTFGSAVARSVRISLADGVVTLLGDPDAAAFPLTGPPSFESGTVAGVRFDRPSPVLTSLGLSTASLTVHLPAGFGVAATASSRRLRSTWSYSSNLALNFSGVQLDSALNPTASSYAIPCAYAAHEGAPLKFTGGAVTWNVAAGSFTVPGGAVVFERSAEVAAMSADVAAGRLAFASEGNRRSNDGYYRTATTGSCTVTANPAGVAVLAATVSLGAGNCLPHFPQGGLLTWNAASTLTWAAGNEAGALTLTSGSTISQRQDHRTADPRDPCGKGGPDEFGFLLDTDRSLVRTAGGGIRAEGSLTTSVAGNAIRWGFRDGGYGWKLNGASAASIYMPGNVMKNASTWGGQAAGALLLAGRGQPGDAAAVELPGTTDYAKGGTDYAGLNVRVSQNTAMTCNQAPGAIANPIIYGLKPCSKYNLRLATHGRHEAVGGAAGSTPLWGYSAAFQDIAITFLDSRIKDSQGLGTLHVGTPAGPANFDLSLQNFIFGGTGEVRSAAVSASTPPINLDYWGTACQVLTCDFRFPLASPGGCENRDSGFPLLGVSCQTAFLREPLRGALGFKTNGNLIAAGDPLAVGTGVDSRLRVPSRIRVEGNANGSAYNLTPVTGAAFNNWEAPDKPVTGFLSLAGKLDVPFFADMEVHAHFSPNRAGQIYLMNSWTDPAGKTAFKNTDFDATNHGWPAGVALEAFRKPVDATSAYHPRVQRRWKGLDLDFRVRWDALRRQFVTITPPDAASSEQHIFVLDVPTELRTLSPTVADIGFGVRLGDLPVLNSQQLLSDHFEGFGDLTGALHDAVNAGGTVIYNAAAIPLALSAIDQLMEFDPGKLFDPALDAMLPQSIVDALYNTLQNAYAGADSTLGNLCERLDDAAQSVDGLSFKRRITFQLALLSDLNGASQGLANTIKPKLEAGENGIDAILQLIAKDPSTGERKGVARLIQAIIAKYGSTSSNSLIMKALAGSGATFVDGIIIGNIQGSEQGYQNIERVLGRLKARTGELRAQISNGEAFMQRLADGWTLNLNATTDGIAQKTITRICSWLQTQLDVSRTLVQDRPQEIRDYIRATIKEFFVETVVVSQLRSMIRNMGNELREILHDGFDAVMAEANGIIDKLAEKALEVLPGPFPSITVDPKKFINVDALSAVDIKGYARIAGDSLEELRLDARYAMENPDKMEFRGWLLVKNVTSTSPGSSCHAAGANGVEITLGASAPLSGLGFGGGQVDGDTSARAKPSVAVSLLFAMDNSTPVPKPLGADGRFDLTGPLSMGPVTLQKVSLGAGVSAHLLAGDISCTYLFGRATGAFNGKEAEIALFAGGHNDINSLGFMREDIKNLIGIAGPAAGFYVHASAWVSINELFGIPDSCLLRINAKFGGGLFGFSVPGGTKVGGIVDLAAKAEVLCLVNASGELVFVPAVFFPGAPVSPRDSAAAPGAVFTGDAILNLKATIGYCPFCKDFSKDFGAHATISRDGFDLDFE